MATQYAFGKIVTDGLVLALDAADRNSYVSGSATWIDLSGNNNSGSLINGPTFSTANGGSIVFDGTNDYTDLGDPMPLSIPDSVSVNVWFNISVLGGWRGIIAKRLGGATTNYGINFNSDSNVVQWYYNNGTSGFRIISTPFSANFTSGVWYNICGVFAKNEANTNGILYKNGVSIASGTLFGNIAAVATPVTVGSSNSTTEFFRGSISSAAIYNRALSANEVTQNYNALKSRFGL
jgi:hypothetical protein